MKSQPVRSMLEGLRKHQALFVSYGTPVQHVLYTATREEFSRRLARNAAASFHPVCQLPLHQPAVPACTPTINPTTTKIRNRAVSCEHDRCVTAIADALGKKGIRHYVSKGQGPDLVAYAKIKVAIEYETGRKPFGASYGMILSRKPEYGIVIVVVNDLHYMRYSGISCPGIVVFRFSELGKAISAIGEDL